MYRNAPPTTVVHATWRLTPNNFSDVVNAADTVVEAQVESVQAGAPIVVPAPGEPGGQDVIPTERVTVNVRTTEKGNAKAGERLVIFQTGGQRRVDQPRVNGRPDESRNHVTRMGPQPGGKEASRPDSQAPERKEEQPDAAPAQPASGGTKIYLLPESPPYEVGATYYLALENGPENTKRPVHPAGRYKVNPGNRLQATGDDPVSQSLNGRDLALVKAAAQGRANIPTNPPPAAESDVQRRETTGEGQVGMPRTGADNHVNIAEPMIFFWIGIALVIVALGLGLVSFAAGRRQNARRL
jgi:hypothetical protein